MNDGKVVDLTTVRLMKDASTGLREIVRSEIRRGVEHIADMYPEGRSDDWIDAKSEASVRALMDMIDAAMKPLPIPLPESISDADRAAIEASARAWGREQNEICRNAFANQLVALLGP